MVIELFIFVTITILIIFLLGSNKKYKKAYRTYNVITNKLNKSNNLIEKIKYYKFEQNGYFELIYVDFCMSNEEKIKNKLLNIKRDLINIIIHIEYTDNFLSLTVKTKIDTDIINEYYIIRNMETKKDINYVLNELDKIDILRKNIIEFKKSGKNYDKLAILFPKIL